jgi:hypothetical protein
MKAKDTEGVAYKKGDGSRFSLKQIQTSKNPILP